MELEVFLHAVELGEAAFCEAPETFDPIDMDAIFREIFGLIDPEMLVISHINEPVIAAPAIGVDHRVKRDLATNNVL